MRMRRVALGAVALLAATVLQGCAVFYATDKTEPNGSTERQFGLFGGCLPLWHYRSEKPSTQQPKPEVKAKETPKANGPSVQ
jgi:hypothetical protein